MPVNPNDYAETYTGRQFRLDDPRPRFSILDIARSLSQKCRYNGHTRRFYSVAEHCVTIAYYLDVVCKADLRTQYHGLMHDGSEGYLPDIVKPFKWRFPELVAEEHRLDGLIREWAGLDHDVPRLVKELDVRIVKDERAQVCTSSRNVWTVDGLEPLRVKLHGWDPETAYVRFLSAYQTIASEYLGRPVLLAYDEGEFLSGHHSDLRRGTNLDYRLIDLRGGVAQVGTGDEMWFQHADFDLFVRR